MAVPTPEPLQDLALSAALLDRRGNERSDEALAAALDDASTRVLALEGHLARVRAGRLVLRPPEPDDRSALAVLLGHDERTGTAYVGVQAPTPREHDDELHPLRGIAHELDPFEANLLATASALANWHATHTHCPRCGTPTEPSLGGWIRVCAADGSEHYPRTDPAVIVSVIDEEDRLLLARNAAWPPARFSVLAGFCEPGESLETAVAREVLEEVGVRVRDVRYLGSQPWPFPASVMLGFTARAESTEIRCDATEIAQARWVRREEYAAAMAAEQMRTPSGVSIARRLIERWYGEEIEPTNTW